MSFNNLQTIAEPSRPFIAAGVMPVPGPNPRSTGLRLAHYAITGWIEENGREGREPLDYIAGLCRDLAPSFIARVAVAARESGILRDTPVLLLAVLAVRDLDLFETTFPRVIDGFDAVSRFVAVIKSGVAGRRSLGSRPRRLVRQWLAAQSDEAIRRAADLPLDPPISQVIGMVHPRPESREREALYGDLVRQNQGPCNRD